MSKATICDICGRIIHGKSEEIWRKEKTWFSIDHFKLDVHPECWDEVREVIAERKAEREAE